MLPSQALEMERSALLLCWVVNLFLACSRGRAHNPIPGKERKGRKKSKSGPCLLHVASMPSLPSPIHSFPPATSSSPLSLTFTFFALLLSPVQPCTSSLHFTQSIMWPTVLPFFLSFFLSSCCHFIPSHFSPFLFLFFYFLFWGGVNMWLHFSSIPV